MKKLKQNSLLFATMLAVHYFCTLYVDEVKKIAGVSRRRCYECKTAYRWKNWNTHDDKQGIANNKTYCDTLNPSLKDMLQRTIGCCDTIKRSQWERIGQNIMKKIGQGLKEHRTMGNQKWIKGINEILENKFRKYKKVGEICNKSWTKARGHDEYAIRI